MNTKQNTDDMIPKRVSVKKTIRMMVYLDEMDDGKLAFGLHPIDNQLTQRETALVEDIRLTLDINLCAIQQRYQGKSDQLAIVKIREKPDPDMLTPEDLAERMQFHPESIRRLIRTGSIKAKKFGNSWRIPKAVANSIIANGFETVEI